jgi:GTP-binding protein
MFIDRAKIIVKAGDGGNGCISFRREKYVPKGGPDGGDGGRGGNVIIRANPSLKTLQDPYIQHFYKAERGRHGQGKNKHGKNGRDRIIEVPVGTEVYNFETKKKLVDLVEPYQEFIVAKGGEGGRGNQRFASSTNRAPDYAEDGKPGEVVTLELILKLLAEVGLIGYPNAGKSTLLSRLTSARPKIADYPFTTLTPQLGVVKVDEFTSFTIADIPGLIEGAHKGAGLGDKFLQHIERTKFLVHLLDGSEPDFLKRFKNINREMELYHPKIAQKPQIVAFNKMDLEEARKNYKKAKDALKNFQFYPISAVTGYGLKDLLFAMAKMLK